MQPGIYYTSTGAVWADALFVSAMQRSDKPGRGQVLKAITAAVCAHGHRGCAERVAQEFGDHPEAAVARMRWARAMAREAVGWVPEPTPDGVQRRLGLPSAGLGQGSWRRDEAHPYQQAEHSA
jgi:hypothetical protein